MNFLKRIFIFIDKIFELLNDYKIEDLRRFNKYSKIFPSYFIIEFERIYISIDKFLNECMIKESSTSTSEFFRNFSRELRKIKKILMEQSSKIQIINGRYEKYIYLWRLFVIQNVNIFIRYFWKIDFRKISTKIDV